MLNLEQLERQKQLSIATLMNDFNRATQLLNEGANPDLFCVQSSHAIDSLEFIVDTLSDSRSEFNSATVIAAYTGNAQMMELFIKHGAQPQKDTYVYYDGITILGGHGRNYPSYVIGTSPRKLAKEYHQHSAVEVIDAAIGDGTLKVSPLQRIGLLIERAFK